MNIKKNSSFLSHQNKSMTIFQIYMVLFSITFSGIVFGPNLNAEFWIIDDHSILSFIKKAHYGIWDFIELLKGTEVGQFGHSSRYRPGYYVLYIFETLLWGDSPFLWYLSRLLMCSFFIYACLSVFKKYMGFAYGVLFVLLSFSYLYWSDIWSRLGPGESYCALGLGLFVLGFSKLWKYSPESETNGSLLMSVGVFVAAGAKENFLVLLIPTGILLFQRIRSRTVTKSVLVAFVFCWIYMSVIFVELALALSKVQKDIQANDVSFLDRIQKLSIVLTLEEFYVPLVLFVVFAILYFLQKYFSFIKENSSTICLNLILLPACIFLLLAQVIFYNGIWPTGMRYDFPGRMILPFVIVLSLFSIQMFFKRFRIVKWLPLVMIIVFLPRSYHSLRILKRESKSNVARTEIIKKNFDKILELGKTNQDSIFVIESYDPLDYESIISIKVFLDFYQFKNKIYIRTHEYDKTENSSDLYKILSKSIRAWEKESDVDLIKPSACYSIFIRNGGRTNCLSAAQF